MTEVDGSWNIDVVSPFGSLQFVLDLAQSGKAISGSAQGAAGEFAVQSGERTPDGVRFSVDVKAPVPLALALNLRIDGDSLTGSAKAGFLSATVTGSRASAA